MEEQEKEEDEEEGPEEVEAQHFFWDEALGKGVCEYDGDFVHCDGLEANKGFVVCTWSGLGLRWQSEVPVLGNERLFAKTDSPSKQQRSKRQR
eukprot:12703429-Alexandrium_andersonii.AAC.1